MQTRFGQAQGENLGHIDTNKIWAGKGENLGHLNTNKIWAGQGEKFS